MRSHDLYLGKEVRMLSLGLDFKRRVSGSLSTEGCKVFQAELITGTKAEKETDCSSVPLKKFREEKIITRILGK